MGSRTYFLKRHGDSRSIFVACPRAVRVAREASFGSRCGIFVKIARRASRVAREERRPRPILAEEVADQLVVKDGEEI